MEEIIIIHTNDLHSHFENWPRLRRYILRQQEVLKGQGKTVITLDLGDFSDRVHPLTEGTNGQANTLLMNQVNYDLATIGNNEGIGNSFDQLNHLYDQANFSVVLANLRNRKTGEQPQWAKPYQIVTSQGGTRLGFIALTAPFPLTYNPNGWDVYEADQLLPELVQEVQEQSDIIILMSHLGVNEDQRIAEKYPEIKLILGSHTHHLFIEGKQVNETLLAAAGKFGRYAGMVHLTTNNYQLIKSEASVQVIAELEEESGDQEEIANYFIKGQGILSSQVVGYLPVLLDTGIRGQNTLIDLALKAVANYGKCEVALLNSGLFLANLEGRVSNADLHRCLPHPMHLVRVTLSGLELLEFTEELKREQAFLKKLPIVGMGFRGKIFGELKSQGLDWQKADGQVRWLGKVVEPDKNYQFVTVDHLLFLPFFPTLQAKGQLEMLFPDFLRHVIADYLTEYYPCH